MTHSLKPSMETLTRVLLTIIVLFNAVVPTTVLAMPPGSGEPAVQSADAATNSLPAMQPVYYQPSSAIPNPTRFSPQPDEPAPLTPVKDPVEFSISTSKGEVDGSGEIEINALIRNNSEISLGDITYFDKLEDGIQFVNSSDELVNHNFFTDTVTYKVDTLLPGEEATFSYVLDIQNNKTGKLAIHNAEIEYDLNGETRAQTTSLGFAYSSALVDPNSLIVVPDQVGDGWESAGRYSLYLGDEVLSQDAVVSITPADIPGNGPDLQFNLELIQTTAPVKAVGGELNEQDVNLTKYVEAAFDSPAYLEINLDGVADLTHIPAGLEPYVVTYDEENNVWVKVPIVEENIAANSVTVPAAHFSTWGAGLGNSLPKNGANVLLFDQPYTSLFTGASRYSVPIWTPPGRAGVSPDISLSYSSATVDGVLGDVQAPWVGVGWNIDGIEIVRKIITNENGYGYINSFALTLNGTVYELLVDPNNPNRYYTKQGSFLYVERHNFALGNAGAITNKTGEWWEVVTTDGTRYRLGWNTDSEQLALMYGYGCKTGNPCTTPGGAYATLGYAGKADDLVALRWRVDRITDTHGNTITYTYTETQPSGATMLAPFDRESYLHTISYTGFEGPAGTLSPGYEVEFVTAPRSGIGDVPTTFNIWDNLDSKYLDRILIKCLLCGGSSQLIRTYDFNYSLAPVPNANGTLTLSDIQISGEGFSESGQAVPEITAPTIKFTYQNLDNRNVTGTSNDRYTYPRLQVINNGTGGLLTYGYETDGRGIDSWYDYRVKDVNVNGGLGTAAAQSYTYTAPVYTGSGGNANLGDLIGYTSTSEKQLDYNNGNAVILETKHNFGTQGLDTGYELKTESLSGTTVLRRTTNTYVTDNSKAPFSGWNYRYLFQKVNYVNSGGAIVPASKVVYSRDPSTGNLLLQTDYLGLAAYRKTYYEYLTNPDPATYILDKASRVLVVDASSSTLTDTRYHYDDKLNSAPVWGDLTLTQSLTGSGTSTVDTGADYDVYGNVIRQIQYTSYGTVNVKPTGGTQESSMVYDSTFQSYPVTQTNPMGQDTSTAYLYRLGVPYQATDANGWVTTTTYDSLGRQLSIRVPGVQDESVWYTYPVPNGNGSIPAPYSVEMQILDTTAGIYRSVWGIYDGMGRQIQMQVFDDDVDKILVTDSEFNAQGAVSRQSSPYYVNAGGGYYTSPLWGQYTSSQYDALGRVTQVTQPGNIVSTTSYDGFTTTSIDPKGNKTERATDGLGRLTLVREYSDSSTVYATTRYANDELNRLVRVTDAQSNVTELTYDWLGRKTGMDDPDMGIWTYQYNPTGTLQQQTDARTQTLSFTYDALNRLLTKTGSGVNTSNTYGNTLGLYGFRTGMTDGSGTTSWTYSNFGRTVTEQRAFTGTTAPRSMTTESDWLGRPLRVTYPDGEVLSYTYDALGRPDKLNSSAGPAASLVDLTYNVLGQVTKQTLGNGLEVTNSYDSANNRLVSRASTGDLINFGYTYDPAGNITGITDAALNETHQYTYDFLNRLKTASAFTTGNTSAIKYDQQFEYDKVGNITEMNNWVTPTPIGALNSKASLELISPVSYRSPQLNNAAGSGGFLAMPARQVQNTDTPTDTLTPTDTFTPTDTPTITLTPTYTATSTRTLTPTNTRVLTNTPVITPTATVTPWSGVDAYTSAMLHFNGADGSTSIIDETGKVWTVNGAAQIDTAQSKFGDSSSQYYGASDYLTGTDGIDFDFPANFTIDFWVRLNATGITQMLYDARPSGANGLYPALYISSANVLVYNTNSGDRITGATALTSGAWYHVALVKSGTSTKLYLNGTQEGSAYTDSNSYINGTSRPAVGASGNSIGTSALNGWIDELRVSKGVARWTANFTPPTVAYGYGPEPSATSTVTSTQSLTPTKTNTPTITFTPSKTPTPYTITPTASKTPTPTITFTPTPHFASLLGYWSFEGSSGTTVYDDALGDVTANNATLTNGPVIQPSGAQGSSLIFDGINDYASIADQTEINKNGSFTISAWINPASLVTSRTQYIVQKGAGNKDYGLITVSTQGTATPTANPGNSNANGSIAFQVGDLTPNTLYGPILPVNTWTMVTGVYDSTAGQMRLYLNGQLVASQGVTGTVTMNGGPLTFSSSAAANVYHGSLDEVRFYSRSLTDSEIQSVYGIFTAPTPLPMSSTPIPTIATPNIPSIPLEQQPWGTGMDDNLTITSGNTFNINTSTNGYNGRTCADGAAYNVTGLGDTAATLDSAPEAGCLNPGDELLLIQLSGDSATGYNAGSYEFLRLASLTGSTVNFVTSKTKWYGSAWRSDMNIGIGTGQQRVMLMRVPNYNDVTINGTLTAASFNGNKYGVVVFRVLGTLSGAGSISADRLGFNNGAGYGVGGIGATNSDSGAGGGGGSYGTKGTDGKYASSGNVYGENTLTRLYLGSSGGDAGVITYVGGCGPGSATKCNQGLTGPEGSAGGGIVLLSAQTINNYTGTITSNGENSRPQIMILDFNEEPVYSSRSGAGAGGSVRIEGGTITLNSITVNGGTASNGAGAGGQGRIAVYDIYGHSIVNSSVAPYFGSLSSPTTATATHSPTPTSIVLNPSQPLYGSGKDGDLTIGAGQTYNISTQNSNSRTCGDGGDAVAYSVLTLNSSSAKVPVNVGPNCLKPGDEILLIHLNGAGPNVGNYEFLQVGGVTGDTVYFKAGKSNWYGANSGDDSGIGTGTGQQRVMLMRVPNYDNVTIDGTLTAASFDGNKNGVIVFRVLGTLSGAGSISADRLGFNNGAGYGMGGTGGTNSDSGAGGGGGSYGTKGTNGKYANSGNVYGENTVGRLYLGSSGGDAGVITYSGGCGPGNATRCNQPLTGPQGSAGGGVVLLSAQTINYTGAVTSNGENSRPPTSVVDFEEVTVYSSRSGAGAGGSVRIEGGTITVNNVTVNGGTASNGAGAGGQGRIAVYYSSLPFTSSLTSNNYTLIQQTGANPTATPTSVIPGFDSNVKVLLHMDGSDASTTFADQTGRSWTANGDAQVDTDQYRFGGASIKFDGTGDYLSTTDDVDFDFEGDFTIDFWFRPNILGTNQFIYDARPANTEGVYPVIWISGDKTIHFSVNGVDRIAGTTLLNTGTWYHAALARSGNSTKLFLNGIQEGSTYTDNNLYLNGSSRPVIGGYGTSPGGYGFKGWLDELRVSKGVARWTSNFTPPTAGYYSDSAPTPTLSSPGTGGLISWWGMNEASGTRADSYGLNHLADNNTVMTQLGKVGYAADFESTNSEYFEAADNASLSTGDIDFTISAWIKIETLTGAEMTIIGKQENSTTKEWKLIVDGPTSLAGFRLYNSSGSQIGSVNATTFGTLTTGTWYYVVAWHDSVANTVNIQVNNGTTNSAATTGVPADTTAKLRIGSKDTAGTLLFDGLIDEAIFHKKVLTSAEKDWFYNDGNGQSYSALVASPTSTPTPTAFPTGWVKRTYAYSETIPHAVTSLVDDAQSTLAEYAYDANGNMTCRTEDGVIYKQVYNTENRISSIQKLAEGTCDSVTKLAMQWDFAYDGDGVRTATMTTPYDTNGSPQSPALTSYYFGGAYEVTGSSIKKYYSFGGQTVMRDANGLQYFLTDHLGSVVAVTSDTGSLITQQRYLPFGGERTDAGDISQTDLGYTGQRKLDSGMGGLMDYKARMYSPYINRFLQPDSLIPDPSNPQAWNRYSYVLNNPLRYSDPTGHRNCEEDGYNCPGDKITTKKTPQFHFNSAAFKDKLGLNLTAASFLPGYNIIKSNSDQAWKIITNPRATFGQRLGASTYTTVAWGAYAVYAIGSVIAMKGRGGEETTPLPNEALVCRGGTCTAERFANASGATTNSDGTLNGVSVNSGADSSLESLTQGIPNKQVGVTTAGDVRAAGGNIYPKPLDNNPYHAEINGLTPAQLESLFTPTRPNPWLH